MAERHTIQLALLNALKELRQARQERDDALKTVEHLQQQLADSQTLSRTGTWHRTEDWDIIRWSDQTYRIHGIPIGTPISRKTILHLIHEDDRERVQAQFNAAIEGRFSFQIVYRIRRPDGKVRILHADNMVSADGPDSKAVLNGAVHDITDFPVPSSTASLPLPQQDLPEDSLILDTEGIILKHSGTFSKWVRNLESGSSVFRLFMAEESHEMLAEAMDALESDMLSKKIELSMDTSDPEAPRQFILQPWRPFGEWWGFVLCDQTSHPETSDSQFSVGGVFEKDLVIAGAWEYEVETGNIIWSKSMYEIMEMDPSEVPLSQIDFSNLIVSEDREEFDRMALQQSQTKLPIELKLRIRLPSGNEKTLLLYSEYLNRTSVGSHLMGTITDISHTTDLQEAARLWQLRETSLHKALNSSRLELTMASLRLQTAQVEERLRIATELHDEAGGMLTALNLSFAELEGQIPQESYSKVSRLMDQLTEQIRKTTRKIRPAVLQRFGLVEGLKELARDNAILANWTLSLDLPSANTHIDQKTTDAVFGIAREAILNALKHAQASHLEVNLHSKVDGYVLQIRDDGVGLPEDMHPEISTGLGMATMRDRAEALGGSVTFESPEKGGTRIVAFFPLIPE